MTLAQLSQTTCTLQLHDQNVYYNLHFKHCIHDTNSIKRRMMLYSHADDCSKVNVSSV